MDIEQEAAAAEPEAKRARVNPVRNVAQGPWLTDLLFVIADVVYATHPESVAAMACTQWSWLADLSTRATRFTQPLLAVISPLLLYHEHTVAVGNMAVLYVHDAPWTTFVHVTSVLRRLASAGYDGNTWLRYLSSHFFPLPGDARPFLDGNLLTATVVAVNAGIHPTTVVSSEWRDTALHCVLDWIAAAVRDCNYSLVDELLEVVPVDRFDIYHHQPAWRPFHAPADAALPPYTRWELDLRTHAAVYESVVDATTGLVKLDCLSRSYFGFGEWFDGLFPDVADVLVYLVKRGVSLQDHRNAVSVENLFEAQPMYWRELILAQLRVALVEYKPRFASREAHESWRTLLSGHLF
jgi:hypothetical protein